MTITEIVAKLRLWAETSTSKGKVLSEAAALTERMEADLRRTDQDCLLCSHAGQPTPCMNSEGEAFCDDCPFDCYCKECQDNSKWEYKEAPADCKQVQVTEPLRPNGLTPPQNTGARKNAEEIYRRALDTYGSEAQTLMVFEEFSELQKELCKHARGKDNRLAIAEEIADVFIMLQQMMILHDCVTDVDRFMDEKIIRLEKRLDERAAQNESSY